MLIKNGNLDFEELKSFFKELEWKKVPRKLGPDHLDFFYVGYYESDEKIVEIKVRPSLRMQVTESFKNRIATTGKEPPKEYKGILANFGSTIEVVIDKSVIEKLKKLAKPKDKPIIKKFSLD